VGVIKEETPELGHMHKAELYRAEWRLPLLLSILDKWLGLEVEDFK
jgi:hypothetical protein